MVLWGFVGRWHQFAMRRGKRGAVAGIELDDDGRPTVTYQPSSSWMIQKPSCSWSSSHPNHPPSPGWLLPPIAWGVALSLQSVSGHVEWVATLAGGWCGCC